MPIGKLMITAIRKNHFIKVMLLYLAVNGLTIIMYKPYDVAFTKIKALPNGMFGAVIVEVVLKKININAPIKPKTAPEIFTKVIFSRIKTAESIKTIIGEIVTITEELMGVDRLKPLNEKSILMTIPKRAQPNMRSQSRR